MLRFTFEDGSKFFVLSTASLVTNKGPLLASQVVIGIYVRCGTLSLCRVDDIAAL